MAQEKPPGKNEGLEHQDKSIKARKFQLYEERDRDGSVGAVKPFAEYVRQTPPAPLSPATKATLWALGVLIALLFIAALIFGGPKKVKRPRAEQPAPRAFRV